MGDSAYLQWLRNQRCAVQPCILHSEAHHSLSAPTYAPGERQPKQLPGKRGQRQKSADYYAFSMCPPHHKAEFHGAAGFFEGWSNEERDAWEAEMSAKYRIAYEAELAAKGQAVEVARPSGLAPVPGSHDAIDLEDAADRFLESYPTIGQPGRHDFIRAMKSVVKATREGRIVS